MSTTSVSLGSLKFLLQHMDANKRFEIYRCCPSLREFEKTVPLKIKSLVLTEKVVIVNDTTYQIGIIRKYNVGVAPRFVTAINTRGGVFHEVDRYGIRNEPDQLLVTPGDVEIRLPGLLVGLFEEDVHVRILENRIRNYGRQLAHQRERRSNRNLKKVARIKKAIEDARAKLFDYQCRRDNIPPNFEQFFQLTKSRIINNLEQKTIQRYIHNKKYSEVFKQLTTVLFGGRSSPIFVEQFKLVCSHGVIRLPIGLKLQIEQLVYNTSWGTTVDVLASILHESSFPLKKLEVEVLSEEDVTSPIVNTAASLKIEDFMGPISSITNPVVHITMDLSEETIVELVGQWIVSQRPVGYEYIFEDSEEPPFADEMEDILKKLNGVPIDDENVIIPMSEVTLLKVSYGPFPEFAPTSKWAVRFLTEAIEH